MDTKLKSSHRLGVLIVIVSVVLAAAATIGLYPYMEEKARNEAAARQSSNQLVVEKDIALQVMNSSYEAWSQQIQEEQGQSLTPSQVFLPELEDKLREKREGLEQEDTGSEYSYDYYQELQSVVDQAGESWQRLSAQHADRLRYEMRDLEGNLLRSNVRNPQQEFSAPGDQEILFTVEFGPAGNLKVISMEGDIDSQNRLNQALSQYEFYDPIQNRCSENYTYSGLRFQGPENVRLTFCSSTDQADWYPAYRLNDGDIGVRAYVRSGEMYTVVAAMCLLITVLALVLPAVKSLEIGKSRLCRAAFEPVCFLGVLWLCMLGEGTIPGGVVAGTMEGIFQAELLQAGFLPLAASALTLLLNLAFWIGIYGLLYWGITCLGSVFYLGLWQYFKERTWLGRFCRMVKRFFISCMDAFVETDWRSKSTRIIGKAVIANFLLLSLITILWFWGIGALIIYSLVLFILLQKSWRKLEAKYDLLLDMVSRMAGGQLDADVQEDLGILEPLKEQLTTVRQGFKKAVEQEVKSERTKTELITNVSHDLKTPLTAIITYVNLLKQPDLTEEERQSYIQVLDQKSMRLKSLIEDLFEVSKANSKNVNLHLEQVDLVSLMKQVKLELSDKLDSCDVDFRWGLPEEKVVLELDSQKTYRIFENLLVNITKYAMKGTRAYVEIQDQEEQVVIIMRNVSATEFEISPEELTDRFVRGDQSRNSEGSGLGLAIAKSFTELQGGKMEVTTEGDLFRVVICWEKPRL